MIKGVIFDLDGLLVNSEPIQYQTNKELLNACGKDYSPQLHRLVLGRSLGDGLGRLKKELGLKEGLEELVRLRNEILRSKINDINFMPGGKQLLQTFKEAGLSLAVATSAPRWYLEELRQALDLENYVPVFVSIEDVKNPKPAPDLFLAAAKELRLKPQQCLVLEDAPVGIEAALSAGMRTMAVLHQFTKKEDFPQADFVVDSLEAVSLDLIKRLSSAHESS